MISKSLAIALSLVFSLLISGPAFSDMSCAGHMMQMSVDHGSGSSGASHHQKMDMKDCCLSVDCRSFSSATVQTRFYEIEPLVLSQFVWNICQIEPRHANVPELFRQRRLQQGPPLSLVSSYKTFLARTTRQNI